MMASKSAHGHPHEAVEESKLIQRGPYDAKDEFEFSLFQSFTNLQSQLIPPYKLLSQSAADLVHLNQALVYGVLTQPRMQQSLITHLAAVTSDGYACFVSILLRLVNECYPKLLEQSRTQLLWLVRQLISLSASEVDGLCLCLLRCIVGGDISHWNVWLSGQMLDIFRSNWIWLIGNPGLLTTALFTFLRLLPDHFMAKSPALNELKQDEAAFCVKILRDCFQDCLVIGRDLVRLLQDVAFIPEFEPVWKDLLSNPSAFNAAGFADIAQLYVVRTPARYLASRLTPEMEAQIRFMLTYVRMGNQRRYQAWFAQRFLSAPGSETLVCDLIRFICGVHHPTNQILQSDIVPRWAVVGWLLKCCKSHHAEANAKLALFYDWFFFMSKTDNIMNIEPALLLMVYSIPKYMDITHSLLEFLFLCMEHYDPSRKDLIFRGVLASVDILVGKGVVRSLEPLSSSPHVVPWLREKLVAYFPIYCQADSFDAYKGAKQEGFPQDFPGVGPAPMVGAKNSFPVQIETPIKPEMNCVAEGIFGGNHHKAVESGSLGQPNMELSDGTLDNIARKKRRIDVVTPDDLAKALTRSQEEAVNVFEKLILSFLFEADKVTTDRRKDLTKAEGSFNEMADHVAESSEIFAQKVSGALKGSGYNLFAPLSGHSSDSLETDEIMSVTSAVLRMYTQSHHPQLLQMLLSWHNEGFAVGARLLCYVCRLVEDPSQSYTSVDVQSKSGVAMQLSVKHGKEPHEYNGQSPLPKGSEAGGISALSWHQGMQINEPPGKFWKVCSSQASGVTSNAQECCAPSVANAFKAYEEYLKGVKKKGRASSGASPSADLKLANGTLKEEVKEEADDDLQPVLLRDLETLLTWSIHRLLFVLSLVFTHLPDLSRGKKQVIKLLVSVVDPVELSKLELKLYLKEMSVLGLQPVCLTNLIKSSLSWDCFEQQYLWRLLVAEMQNVAPLLVTDFVKSCTAFLDPSQHCDAVSGLLVFLRMQCPTSHLISTVLLLPQNFGRLVAAVFASWVSVDTMGFLGCLNALASESLQPKQEISVNLEQHGSLMEINDLSLSALSSFLSFLDNFLRRSSEMDEKKKMEVIQIKHTLLKIVKRSTSKLATFTQDALANSEEK